MELSMKQTQKGFTLLEVMVTLLIISFGLLGLAGIIANSLKYNQSAYASSVASLMANDIIDRMRANQGAAQAIPSPYNLAMAAATPTGTDTASTDLMQWRNTLAATLPSGTGSVNINANGTVSITVRWDDSRAAKEAGVTRNFTVETRL
jgi:type IV pilus assembly protein PilV